VRDGREVLCRGEDIESVATVPVPAGEEVGPPYQRAVQDVLVGARVIGGSIDRPGRLRRDHPPRYPGP
jgi:hypothetical protein